MPNSLFKAVALTNEININKLAAHFGIQRKYKWEEYLTLNETALKGILHEPQGKTCYLFPFGSLVFVDCQHHEINDVIRYLSGVDSSLPSSSDFIYCDEYEIEISPLKPPSVNNDYLVTPVEQLHHREIVATILAKSVALEHIEADIDLLLDEIEDTVNNLKTGNLKASDEQLAKAMARILGFKLSTISYIMLLDKPDITWTSEEATDLFKELSTIFELTGRFENIKHKTDTLMDITNVFAGLSQSKRGTRLEWIIIILIAFEIVWALFTEFLKYTL